MADIVDTAVEDARTLIDAGFPALLVENFGDAPFHANEVGPETIAAMSIAVGSLSSLGVPIGVNVLRNDCLAAIGIAAATGACFIRVNVLTGVMYTDQGPIVGRAAELMRRREALAPGVEVWADVMVKHATPPFGLDVRQAAMDTLERGLADAVIVSGPGTGTDADPDEARTVKKALPGGTRIVLGSGAEVGALDAILDAVDTVIVGSSIKSDGDASNRPDPLRAKAFVEHAAERGLV